MTGTRLFVLNAAIAGGYGVALLAAAGPHVGHQPGRPVTGRIPPWLGPARSGW